MQNLGYEIRESHDTLETNNIFHRQSQQNQLYLFDREKEILRRHGNVSMVVLHSELSRPKNNVLSAVEVEFCEIWVGVLIYTGPNCMIINIVSSWSILIDQVNLVNLISYKLV